MNGTFYTEKKSELASESAALLAELTTALGVEPDVRLRTVNRYSVSVQNPQEFALVRSALANPAADLLSEDFDPTGTDFVLAAESLPGQFDRRARYLETLLKQTGIADPAVRFAKIYMFYGNFSSEQKSAIKKYLINPIESREACLVPPDPSEKSHTSPADIPVLYGFSELDDTGISELLAHYGLAMDIEDIKCCQEYFRGENRDPNLTELKILDTYWSDHCRHTTFNTHITQTDFESELIKASHERYLALRKELEFSPERPVTLMDMATIGAKTLRRRGMLEKLDISEEVNACSVNVKVKSDLGTRDCLLMFKNETHNHPTEIEPLGGAATCLGGAVRDALSGRAHVFQALRLTGAGNPLEPVADTLRGKLPQRKLVRDAMDGYSSYGNQIGIPAGHVTEIYHPGYTAKRMELGALVAVAPKENVVRLTPRPGDVVVLLGDKTGRDGLGGATGSSKKHTVDSLETGGAEVQKGNAPLEHNIQRLFDRAEIAKLIKRCNDFGAGGVAVAVGELADGLDINLDAVPLKYPGMNGTEIALSESQERMAVVLAPEDFAAFESAAAGENLTAVEIARVTDTRRMVIKHGGEIIADIHRDFLDSAGAVKYIKTAVAAPPASALPARPRPNEKGLAKHLCDLRFASQKGLVERFDTTAGAGSVLLPLGGKTGLAPAQVMAAKIPLPVGDSATASVMAWGYDPVVSERSPYHGGLTAVVDSVAKTVAAGSERKECYLSFQEYFEKLSDNPHKWGKPQAALLGALDAQIALGVGAVGGKDSMSGSFEHINVPPALISFAVSVADVAGIISPEFKTSGNNIYLIAPEYNEHGLPNLDTLSECFDNTTHAVRSGEIISARAVEAGGISEAVFKMCVGNRLGFEGCENLPEDILSPMSGAIVAEARGALGFGTLIGRVSADYRFTAGELSADLGDIERAWRELLAPVYPEEGFRDQTALAEIPIAPAENKVRTIPRPEKPLVVLPALTGTNGEVDLARAFERAGATVKIFPVTDRTAEEFRSSVKEFCAAAKDANILAFAGGFAGFDLTEGGERFISAFLRTPQVSELMNSHLCLRDGLVLGISQGAAALLHTGFLTHGKLVSPQEVNCAFVTNRSARHEARFVNVKLTSDRSHWTCNTDVGHVFKMPISASEGRFYTDDKTFEALASAGQIVSRYTDDAGVPTMCESFNPTGSLYAVESLRSPDGRILGRVTHCERAGTGLYKNLPDAAFDRCIAAGLEYFTK